jgi:hypothetical protein
MIGKKMTTTQASKFDRDNLLEVECPHCEGRGGEKPMYEAGWDTCWYCAGAGYIPTELGKQVMTLLMHQSKCIRRD